MSLIYSAASLCIALCGDCEVYYGDVPYVGSLYGLLDVLFIFGMDRRCIHDYLAGTKVVEVI